MTYVVLAVVRSWYVLGSVYREDWFIVRLGHGNEEKELVLYYVQE